MRNRFLVVTALGLAVGLAACDESGQEQAQTPREPEQQQAAPPAREQLAPAPPAAEPEQSPSDADSRNSDPGGTAPRTNE
jgi:hypothetical protein